MAPARVGNMRDEVVDDGEAASSSGGARGGLVRRRLLQGFRGGDLAIELAPARIRWVEWWLRSCERWGVWWCAWIAQGSSPFIAAHGCCEAGWRSTMARRFRRLVELGEVMAMLYVSRRG